MQILSSHFARKLSRGIYILFCVLSALLFTARIFSLSVFASEKTIYVNDFSAVKPGDGTQATPYTDFSVALAAANPNDTIVLLGTSVIRQPVQGFLDINKPLTIRGENGTQTMSLRGVNLQTSANVTFSDINFSMQPDGAANIPIIRAINGDLILNHVTNKISENQLDGKVDLEIQGTGNIVERNGTSLKYRKVTVNSAEDGKEYNFGKFDDLIVEGLGQDSKLNVNEIRNLTFANKSDKINEIAVKNVTGVVNIHPDNIFTTLKLGEAKRNSLSFQNLVAPLVEVLSPELYLQKLDGGQLFSSLPKVNINLPLGERVFSLTDELRQNIHFKLNYNGSDLADNVGKVIYSVAGYIYDLESPVYEFRAYDPDKQGYVLYKKQDNPTISIELYRLDGANKPASEQEDEFLLVVVDSITYIDNNITSYQDHLTGLDAISSYDITNAVFTDVERYPSGTLSKLKFYLKLKTEKTDKKDIVKHKTVYEADVSKDYATRGQKSKGSDGYTDSDGTIHQPVDEVVWVGTKPKIEIHVANGEVPNEMEFRADDQKDYGSPDQVIQGQPAYRDIKTTFKVDPATGEISVDKIEYSNEVAAVRPVTIKGTKPLEERVSIPKRFRYVADPNRMVGDNRETAEGRDGFDLFVTTYTLNQMTGDITADRQKKEHEEAVDAVVTKGVKTLVEEEILPFDRIVYLTQEEATAQKITATAEDVRKKRVRTTIYALNEMTGDITPTVGEWKEEGPSVKYVVVKVPKATVEKIKIPVKEEILKDLNKPAGFKEIIAGAEGEAELKTTFFLNKNTGKIEKKEEWLILKEMRPTIITFGSQAVSTKNEMKDVKAKYDWVPNTAVKQDWSAYFAILLFLSLMVYMVKSH